MLEFTPYYFGEPVPFAATIQPSRVAVNIDAIKAVVEMPLRKDVEQPRPGSPAEAGATKPKGPPRTYVEIFLDGTVLQVANPYQDVLNMISRWRRDR